MNERFEIDIPEGDYDTVAGFIFTSLGRMPGKGDEIFIDGSGVVSIDGEVVRASNGPHSENGGLVNEAVEADEANLGTAVTIAVERVDSHRIETVRIKVDKKSQKLESDGRKLAS